MGFSWDGFQLHQLIKKNSKNLSFLQSQKRLFWWVYFILSQQTCLRNQGLKSEEHQRKTDINYLLPKKHTNLLLFLSQKEKKLSRKPCTEKSTHTSHDRCDWANMYIFISLSPPNNNGKRKKTKLSKF